MSEEKKYYVYVHKYASGPKEGQVFYVGKGQGNRAYVTYGRNTHWENVVNKYGFTPEKVMHFSNEDCAFSFEVAMIRFYKLENLVNISSGGEGGASGRKNSDEHVRLVADFHRGRTRSKETREKISKAAIERFSDPRSHWHTDEKISTWWNRDGRIFVGTHVDLASEESIHLGNLKKVQSGAYFSYKGWKVCGVRNYPNKGGIRNNSADDRVFVCKKSGFPSFVGCKSDFCNFYGYSANSTYAVFSGKTRTMDGWSVREI